MVLFEFFDCIVLQEFACREVHESSGDWILYFATNAELERFISALEMLWDYQNEEVGIAGSFRFYCSLGSMHLCKRSELMLDYTLKT